jgi:UPF0176 protein
MYTVLLFYKYVSIDKPEEFRLSILEKAKELGLLGRVLIAEEGINGTLEGITEKTAEFCEFILSIPEFADMDIKTSEGTGNAFPRLSVKVRNEIVGTRFPKEIDPRKQTGKYLSAQELREWYERGEEFEIIDMRNDYEYKSGHFKNSINPKMQNSRDLPEVLPTLLPLQKKKVVTVCTGGVRCEKMSAYLLANGFTDVHQLHNGMHAYMEKYPGEDFLGTLYTFDQRHTMHFGGEREIVGTCHVCEASTEDYIDCQNLQCHKHLLMCVDCQQKEGQFCSELCKDKATSDSVLA